VPQQDSIRLHNEGGRKEICYLVYLLCTLLFHANTFLQEKGICGNQVCTAIAVASPPPPKKRTFWHGCVMLALHTCHHTAADFNSLSGCMWLHSHSRQVHTNSTCSSANPQLHAHTHSCASCMACPPALRSCLLCPGCPHTAHTTALQRHTAASTRN
jgi:hypothetical protein